MKMMIHRSSRHQDSQSLDALFLRPTWDAVHCTEYNDDVDNDDDDDNDDDGDDDDNDYDGDDDDNDDDGIDDGDYDYPAAVDKEALQWFPGECSWS